MKTKNATRSFPASLSSLDEIRVFINEFAKNNGIDSKQAYKITLAIDEIATNIINYGYEKADKEKETVDLSLAIDNNQFTVILEDRGIPFNPLERALPDEKELSLPLEERKIGGLGIMIAKQSVDSFSYSWEEGKNKNTFTLFL